MAGDWAGVISHALKLHNFKQNLLTYLLSELTYFQGYPSLMPHTKFKIIHLGVDQSMIQICVELEEKQG